MLKLLGCRSAHLFPWALVVYIPFPHPLSTRVDPTLRCTQALCMCPTRELVVQNLQVLRRMAKYTAITAVSTADEQTAGGGGGGGRRARKEKVTDHVGTAARFTMPSHVRSCALGQHGVAPTRATLALPPYTAACIFALPAFPRSS
jgi:hypothetical protein